MVLRLVGSAAVMGTGCKTSSCAATSSRGIARDSKHQRSVHGGNDVCVPPCLVSCIETRLGGRALSDARSGAGVVRTSVINRCMPANEDVSSLAAAPSAAAVAALL